MVYDEVFSLIQNGSIFGFMSSLLEFWDFETLIFEILVIELVKVEIFRFLSQNLPCKWRVVFIGKILGWDTKAAFRKF